MIVLKPGGVGYGCPETIYEYKPLDGKGYMQVDCWNGDISGKNLFGFQITKKMPDRIIQPRIVYLTLNEIRQLYKDPRSIWDKSEVYETLLEVIEWDSSNVRAIELEKENKNGVI